MSNRATPHILATCIIVLSLTTGRAPAQTSGSPAAAALLQNFETVFQSDARLLSSSDAHDLVKIPFAHLLAGLDALSKQEPTLVVQHAREFLVGTKDYLPPSGLGMVRSTFCYIVVLQEHVDAGLDRFFGEPVASSDGAPVWNWSARVGEFGENDPRPSLFYASEIRDSYLLVSNDLQELEDVAAHLTSIEAGTRALSGVPEWRDLNSHMFWAYRRYRHTGILNRDAAGMVNITPAAQTLYFYIDSERRVGILQLRASREDDDTAHQINATKMLPSFKRIAPRLWQSIVPLTSEDKDPDPMFAIGWLFGIGAVV